MNVIVCQLHSSSIFLFTSTEMCARLNFFSLFNSRTTIQEGPRTRPEKGEILAIGARRSTIYSEDGCTATRERSYTVEMHQGGRSWALQQAVRVRGCRGCQFVGGTADARRVQQSSIDINSCERIVSSRCSLFPLSAIVVCSPSVDGGVEPRRKIVRSIGMLRSVSLRRLRLGRRS